MTKLKSEIRELSVEDLDTVSGGMPFYGMGCSANQSAGIGRIVGAPVSYTHLTLPTNREV